MRVFDIHVHTFPEAIAERALERICRTAGITPATDGTREGLLASMRRAAIGGALNCPVATAPDQVRGINDRAMRENALPVLSLGAMHPDFPNPRAELARIGAAGLRGIKLHPEFQEFTPADARLQPVWEACAELGLAVLLHCGADLCFPGSIRCPPKAVADLADRFPTLTLIAAHLGGWQCWDEVEACLAGTTVFLETSYASGFLPDGRIMKIIRRHGARRVLFGTDCPWYDQQAALKAFLRLPLDEAERERILWANAADLLGLEPEEPAPDPGADSPFPDAESRNRLLRTDDEDLLRICRFETCRGTGRGGQKRNTTDSAVRVVHPETGLAATSDATRSQHTNRRLALRALRERIALTCRARPAPFAAADRPNRRAAEYPVWVASVLDALASADFRLSDAAAELGLSTGKLSRLLADDAALWQAVNTARARRDLPPLKR